MKIRFRKNLPNVRQALLILWCLYANRYLADAWGFPNSTRRKTAQTCRCWLLLLICLWAAVGLTRVKTISYHCCLKKLTAQQQAHALQLLNRNDLEIGWREGFRCRQSSLFISPVFASERSDFWPWDFEFLRSRANVKRPTPFPCVRVENWLWVIVSGKLLLSLSVANCGFRSQIVAGLSPKFPNLLCQYLVGCDFSSVFKMRG